MVEVSKSTPFDYIRYVLSALILLFSMVVTSYAIVERKTSFWKVVPGWAALILFVVVLALLGIVEGLQIALVELKRQHPESYRRSHPRAYWLGQLASKSDNVERFLMGRQVFVVFLVFFSAKLTTIHPKAGEKFLFPAPQWFRSIFLETGILACVVVVIIAQLMPQIVAAKYPVHFLQFIIMRPAYYACVFVEVSGLTHICWVLSWLMTYVFGMKDDETTLNPNEKSADELLNKVESSLSSCGTTVSSEQEETKKIPPDSDEASSNTFSRFSHLVKTIKEEVDPNMLTVLRYYLDKHPEKFHQYPSVIGKRMYPSPHEISQEMVKDGHAVPKFLTDISDPDHVPPHIVACELLAENKRLARKIKELEKKRISGEKTENCVTQSSHVETSE